MKTPNRRVLLFRRNVKVQALKGNTRNTSADVVFHKNNQFLTILHGIFGVFELFSKPNLVARRIVTVWHVWFFDNYI